MPEIKNMDETEFAGVFYDHVQDCRICMMRMLESDMVLQRCAQTTRCPTARKMLTAWTGRPWPYGEDREPPV